MHSEPIKAGVLYMAPVRENPQLHYLECIFIFLLEKEKANTQISVRVLALTAANEAFLVINDCCYLQEPKLCLGNFLFL